MSDQGSVQLSIGQRVEVIDKQVCGTIAFVGTTSFASGKWVGVELDEPKGNNNGSVQGVSYFECTDQYGIFLRQNKLIVLPDNSSRESLGPVVPEPVAKSPSVTGTPKKSPKPSGSPAAARKSAGSTNEPSKAARTSRLPSLAHNVNNVASTNISSTKPGNADNISTNEIALAKTTTHSTLLPLSNRRNLPSTAEKDSPTLSFSSLSKTSFGQIASSNKESSRNYFGTGISSFRSTMIKTPDTPEGDQNNASALDLNNLPGNSAELLNSEQVKFSNTLSQRRNRRISEIRNSPVSKFNKGGKMSSPLIRNSKIELGSDASDTESPSKRSRWAAGVGHSLLNISSAGRSSLYQSKAKTLRRYSYSTDNVPVATSPLVKPNQHSSIDKEKVPDVASLVPALPALRRKRVSMRLNLSPVLSEPNGTVNANCSSDSDLPTFAASQPRSNLRIRSSRLPVVGKEKEIPKSLQTSPSNSKINLNVTSSAPAPKVEPEGGNSNANKRSSFVERIAEPLVPQYTPGTPGMSVSAFLNSSLATPTNVEDRSTAIQTIETLRFEVKDLTEKVETLKSKRTADQEKLRELDRLRLQVETLSEFKTKVLESQAVLQRELKKAKQDARDATAGKDQHDEEMAELSEAVEMATLDKEMAEEKAEALQLEFEQANEKIEALTTELIALKEEAAGGYGSSDVMNSVQMKQMQAENARLKEALIKVRDSNTHEKHQYQKVLKDAETHKAEVIELSRTKERLEARCNELETQIADLQEQNEAALGAEEMVENLTVKNLNLEEKIAQLAEAIVEMEDLQDINEQLLESAKELEMQLREENQQSLLANQNITRDNDALHETIADREGTILRFRDVVQKLKEENELLQKNLEIESTKSIPGLTEALDFKEIFAKSKAQTTAIDLELRRIEVKEAKLHVQYLNSFMPDGFIKRGGDHDSLLVLLLIPRMIGKVELLLSQVNEKLVPTSLADGIASFISASSQESVSSSPDIERYAFACQFSFLLHTLQSELHRWNGSLSTCSTEAFLKVGLIFADLNIQERAVDFYLELLRKSQLDENIPLENLEKCILAFQNFYSIHLGEEHIEPSTLVSDLCLASVAACDCIIIDVHRLLFMVKKSEKETNVSALLQDLKAIAESLRQLSKKTKRYLPEPPKQPPVTTKLQSQLLNDSVTLTKVVKILQEACKQAVRHTGTGSHMDGIPSSKVEEYLHSAMDKCDSRIEGSSGFKEIIKEWLTTSLMTITDLAQVVNEAPVLPKEKPSSPLSLRAQSVKAELDQTRNLKIQLEDKEAAIKELKQLILAKKEELSEAQIRKELAEKRLSVATKENEMNSEKLNRKIEDITSELQRKKREFEATLEHFQNDLESLEMEKGELKEKLLTASKKSLLEGIARQVNTPTQSPNYSGIIPSPFTSTPVSGNFNNTLQPTSNLIEYTQFLQKQNWRLKSEEVARVIKSLPPIDLGPSQGELDENRKLYQELYRLKGEYFATVKEGIKLLDPKIPKARKRYLHELLLQRRAEISNQIQEMKHRVKEVKTCRGMINVF